MQKQLDPLELSKTSVAAAGESARALGPFQAELIDAAFTFARTAVERNAALAASLTSAGMPSATADIQRAFLKDSFSAASAMATRIAEAYAAAAHRYGASGKP